MGRVQRWLGRESYLLGNGTFWPTVLPGLFYQQLVNRSVEEGHPLPKGVPPALWLQQEGQVGAEDSSLLRIFAGHTGVVNSVAFAFDGRQVLTGSRDQTARLWETSSGRLLSTLQGHTGSVTSVAFSPDSRLALTCDYHGRVLLWRVSGAEMGSLLGMYVATYGVDAVHWQDNGHVVLANTGGPEFRPHFYRLRLEGM